jgi:hypothetical protein
VRYVKGLAIVLMAVVAAPQSAAPTLAITGIAVVDAARGALLRIEPFSSRAAASSESDRQHRRHSSRRSRTGGRGKVPDPGPVGHALARGDVRADVTGTVSANGVTSIRDMGAERFADAKAWRDRIAAGELHGPRMRVASPVVENARWFAAARAMNDRAGTRAQYGGGGSRNLLPLASRVWQLLTSQRLAEPTNGVLIAIREHLRECACAAREQAMNIS